MKQYKVVYEQGALDQFEAFVSYLRFAFMKRFSDTGIFSVNTILANYDSDLSLLEESVFLEFERLGKLSIIGTIYSEEGGTRKTRLIFPIWSYSITAWCLADTDTATLTVESISIHS